MRTLFRGSSQGPQGEPGPEGPAGQPGLGGYTLMNVNGSWSEVAGENNVYETTLTCPAGLRALSVGALNNIVAMAIVGPGNDQGYFRVRVQGGSDPMQVWAQLVCAAAN